MNILLFIQTIFITVLATNSDNVILMLTFLSCATFRSSAIGIGYFLAALIILLLIYIMKMAADYFIPIEYIRFLGLLPLLMGLYALGKLVYLKVEHKDTNSTMGNQVMSWPKQLGLNIITQLSAAIDSAIVFTPILAKQPNNTLTNITFGASFIASILLLIIFSLTLSDFIKINFIKRLGRYLTPFLLILIGAYVLLM